MPRFDLDLCIVMRVMPDDPNVIGVTVHLWEVQDQPDLQKSTAFGEEICIESCDIPELDRKYLLPLRSRTELQPDASALKDLGRELARILLPDRIRTTILAATRNPVSAVRLRLNIEPANLAALPWEYAWLSDRELSGREFGFLALHPQFSIVRCVPATQPTRPEARPSNGRLQLLVAWSDPRSAKYPALPHRDTEFEALRALEQFAECRAFDVRELAGATSKTLRRGLDEIRPHVFHFIGHGDRLLNEGVLVLEGGQQGIDERIRAVELADWIKSLRTRLVVLSACWSGTALNGVARTIAATGNAQVVAMQMPFSDAAAGPFARALYSALAQGCSVEEALRQGRQMIRSAGADWGIPVLYTSGELGPIAEPVAQTRRNNIPYPHDPNFVGREQLLTELHRQLNTPGRMAVSLVAMGGAGKTGVAAEYAHTHIHDYPGGVFWLNAQDSTVLKEEYAALSRFFDVPDDLRTETRAALIRDRLQSATLPTLLVFDNLSESDTRKLLPSSGACRILITTREEWLIRNRAHITYLPLLDEESSLKILGANRTGDHKQSEDELEAVRSIAAMVGHLPLALALAAQHIRRLSLTYREYMASLSQDRRNVLERARRDFIASTEHRGHIFDAIDIACLSLDGTARRVIQTAACLGRGPFKPATLRRACFDLPPLEVADAIAALSDRSLLIGEHGQRLSLHELVCLVVESDVDEADSRFVLTTASGGLAALLAEANESMEWRPIRSDLPHFRHVAQSGVSLAETANDEQLLAGAAELNCQLGVYLFEQGDLIDAENRFELCMKLLGGEQSNSERLRKHGLEALKKLGEVKAHLGDSQRALACVRKALHLARQEFSADSEALIDYYNSVGYVLKRQNKLTRALPYYVRSLVMSRKVCGDGHPTVAMCKNNLGALYHAMGDLGRALDFVTEALEIDRANFGDKHVTVAIRLNNIGRILREVGDLDAALNRHEEALSIYTEAHGREHPDVAGSALLAVEALIRIGTPSALKLALEYAEMADSILSRLYKPGYPLRDWALRLLASLKE